MRRRLVRDGQQLKERHGEEWGKFRAGSPSSFRSASSTMNHDYKERMERFNRITGHCILFNAKWGTPRNKLLAKYQRGIKVVNY